MIAENPNNKARIAPARMAHFVVRTNRFEETLQWYTTLFEADTVFANPDIAFLSFDEEHHRIAIARVEGLEDIADNSSAIDHVAFSYDTLGELLHNYERLAGLGILPAFSINHGPTTSLYYADPNGCRIELQVDNYPTGAEARAFFSSETFSRNPIGIFFDPDLLLAKLKAGEPLADLLKQGAAAASGTAAGEGAV